MVATTDLAKLYQVETKRINETVKNNPDKFPERFSFVLSNESLNFLRSKISTLEMENILNMLLEYLQNKEFICLQQSLNINISINIINFLKKERK